MRLPSRYFSVNIDNDGFKASGFAGFCERLGTGDAFVKSGSYLMHRSHFSDIRSFLLEHTHLILQDDFLAYPLVISIKQAGGCVHSDIAPARSLFSLTDINRSSHNYLINLM